MRANDQQANDEIIRIMGTWSDARIDDLERENARLRAALDSCTAALEEEQELHSEALAEIARLQAEMEAMRGEENG